MSRVIIVNFCTDSRADVQRGRDVIGTVLTACFFCVREASPGAGAKGLGLLGLDVPHLREHGNDACPCGQFVFDKFGDHLHCCQQHAGATHNAHEHLL